MRGSVIFSVCPASTACVSLCRTTTSGHRAGDAGAAGARLPPAGAGRRPLPAAAHRQFRARPGGRVFALSVRAARGGGGGADPAGHAVSDAPCHLTGSGRCSVLGDAQRAVLDAQCERVRGFICAFCGWACARVLWSACRASDGVVHRAMSPRGNAEARMGRGARRLHTPCGHPVCLSLAVRRGVSLRSQLHTSIGCWLLYIFRCVVCVSLPPTASTAAPSPTASTRPTDRSPAASRGRGPASRSLSCRCLTASSTLTGVPRRTKPRPVCGVAGPLPSAGRRLVRRRRRALVWSAESGRGRGRGGGVELGRIRVGARVVEMGQR